MTNRRHLSSSPPSPDDTGEGDSKHAMRRGGARREASERVFLRTNEGKVFEGWALNVSRGGIRAILEDKCEIAQEFDVAMGDAEATPRRGRVVWIQEEPDGVIVGVEFMGLSGTYESVSPSQPPPGDSNQS